LEFTESIESLLNNTNDLKGKQKENVENYAEHGLISKQPCYINFR
jgi:hypothetical protein